MEKKKTQAFFEGRELEAYNLFSARIRKKHTRISLCGRRMPKACP